MMAGWLLLELGAAGAEVFADEPIDQVYAESPLVVWAELSARMGAHDPGRALALGDAIARDASLWLTSTTGADDLHEAERRLWARGGVDELLEVCFDAMRERGVVAHVDRHLAWDPSDEPPDMIYANAGEVLLLLAHVAWRLDLDAQLYRHPPRVVSLVLHEPGGPGRREVGLPELVEELPSSGYEVTGCLFRPLRLLSDRPEPVPPEDLRGLLHYWIPRLSRMSHGAWGESLRRAWDRELAISTVEAWRWFSERQEEASEDYYLFLLTEELGLEAWERGESVEPFARTLTRVRWDRGDYLSLESEDTFAAAAAFEAGDEAAGQRALQHALAKFRQPGRLSALWSEIDTMTLWLALEHAHPTRDEWNTWLPLLVAHYFDEPERLRELSQLVGRVLHAP
jgi:hypothetical protein